MELTMLMSQFNNSTLYLAARIGESEHLIKKEYIDHFYPLLLAVFEKKAVIREVSAEPIDDIFYNTALTGLWIEKI